MHRATRFMQAFCLILLANLFAGQTCFAEETRTETAAKPRPNVIVILADDLGYGDLACYGHPIIKSPHLDRFAGEGIRFTNCYAASANCSPSRTGLMTGRTPYRVGIHNWIPFLSPMHVAAKEITVAALLQKAGYATCHAGKWHLNGMFNLPGQPQPNDHGFEHWFSTQNNALPSHLNPYNSARVSSATDRCTRFCQCHDDHQRQEPPATAGEVRRRD